MVIPHQSILIARWRSLNSGHAHMCIQSGGPLFAHAHDYYYRIRILNVAPCTECYTNLEYGPVIILLMPDVLRLVIIGLLSLKIRRMLYYYYYISYDRTAAIGNCIHPYYTWYYVYSCM